MPLVRISLVKGKPESHRRKIGDAIHRALDSSYLGIAQKRALYRRIADNLAAAVGLRREDAWISLIEVAA